MTVKTRPPVDIRLITTADYHRMADVGILAADEQVELLAGQVIQKMLKGPAHSALCKRVEKLVERRLGDSVLVRLQDPIQLDTYSEPEPDIAIVYPSSSFYAEHHPTASEVFAIIEVSDSTIERDLTLKANLYAAAGIVDYWVINVQEKQLHIFRDPQANEYQKQTILKTKQSTSFVAFPDCTISVSDCFG
ncbi:MAG: Uma2 family endonuclease [Cyanobacteria bacterium J06621_11]